MHSTVAPLVLAVTLAVAPAVLPAQEAPPGPEPCVVEVPEGTGAWRQVRARGITFCLPDDWKESGATGEGDDVRVWQARGGKITLALAGATMPAERPIRIAVRDGERPPEAESRTTMDRQTVQIGGRPALLTDRTFMRNFVTGATWEAPDVRFAGQARDRATAAVQMTVYQTVRFTPAP